MKITIWKVLFSLAAIVTLWFSVKVGKQLQSYYAFSQKISIEVEDWGSSEVGKNQFGVRANYIYKVGEQQYGGTHVFTTPVFMNAEVIDQQLHKWQGLTWEAWYNPAHPEKSSLQHNFPVKASVQALLALGILLYFAWLRFYIEKTA
jgi:hypothetical protein